MIREADLEHLTPTERECLVRYVELLVERLGQRLLEVYLFGSFARGDVWRAGSTMHSDVDLLVLCLSELPEQEREELINATYPLFLQCGRQMSPQFRTPDSMGGGLTARSRQFLERFQSESRLIYHR